MSLDPCPSDAELLRRHAEQQASFGRDPRNWSRTGIGIPLQSPEPSTPIARVGICWPITMVLPWSSLVSDNDKFRASLRGEKPVMLINARYRTAKDKIATLAKRCIGDAAPTAIPLRLIARVYMPNNGTHDMTNFCKLVHDSLEHVLYDNDRWLHDVHWIRAGIDVDAPRAEITITPLELTSKAP